MFKFLKKKLKKFEDKLEEELQTELEKEEEKIQEKKPETLPQKPKTVEKPVEKKVESKKPEPKPVEKKQIKEDRPQEKIKPVEIDADKKVDDLFKKKEKEERKQKIAEDRKKRQEEIDKQIEKSIESELEHAYKTKKSIGEVVKHERRQTRTISDEKLEDLLWDLELGLLESDVAYNVIESIKKDIKDELSHISFERGKIGEIIENVLKNAISNVLMSNNFNFNEFIEKHDKPVVIMFIGVNGSGKTLSIGKIATMLKKIGYSSVMAAGDTFRAGAIEQLGIHADNVGVKVIKHGPGSDPAAVAYDAIEHAKAKHKDVVLLDTAGRVQTNINLMDEMAKIKRVAKPDLIIFVGDALAGNDAVDQAKRFNEIVGIDGVILTKVDTDAKGGSALSVAYTIGKPLLFIGIGQGYEDQVPFDPQWMLEKLFSNE